MPVVCRFKFSDELDMEAVESQLVLAIVTAECTFGQAKVRINAAYCVSKEKPQVVIDVSTDVGESIAQVFTGLMIRGYGEESFLVERLDDALKNKE